VAADVEFTPQKFIAFEILFTIEKLEKFIIQLATEYLILNKNNR
jgi:hypothetical protein